MANGLRLSKSKKKKKTELKKLFLLLSIVLAACSSTQPPVSSETSEGAQKYPPFVIEVNERVLNEVTTFTQTSASKKEFKLALARMKRFEPKTAPVFEKASLPRELLALPLVLTNYTNTPPKSKDDEGGVGLWRFTPFMANNYGLVTAKRDDRLIVVKETQAAGAYLTHLFNLFHDWRFVLIGYCEGEGWLSAAITRNPSANPWEIDLTSTDSQSCLTQTMAVLHIIEHPEVLK
jgi:hypothetical protein